MAAYEHLASSHLEYGYSKQVEDGRIVLLHAAVDGCRNLKNLALRSDRCSIAFQEAKRAMVQWWLLPAALSLLQEVPICHTQAHMCSSGRISESSKLRMNLYLDQIFNKLDTEFCSEHSYNA